MTDRERLPEPGPSRLWLGMILSAAVFLGALGWQSGWLRPPPDTAAPPIRLPDHGRDEWFGIYQGGEKIGYAHRHRVAVPEGVRMTEDTLLRINAMGLVQEISLTTGATLNTDMSLRAFDLRLSSNRFTFRVSGRVDDGAVDLEMDGRRTRLAVKTPVFLTNTVMDAAAGMDPTPGNTLTVRIFDPVAMTQHPVRLRFVGMAPVTVHGAAIEARHLELELLGTRQDVWMDDAGRVLREEGLLGMTLLAESPESARSGISTAPTQDLTRLVAVAIDKEIRDPDRLSTLILRIDGLPPTMDIAGGRQEPVDGRLILRRETIPRPPGPPSDAFLSPSPLVQSDAPEIVAAARAAAGGGADPADKARRLTAWVHANLRKQPVLSVPNALEILENKVGDCNEHAVLLAALGRAVGIPTRIEAGLVYMNGRFYYHAWNAFDLGRWVTADAVFDQMPADLTHVRLVIGGLERQIDLMGVIGRITINVEEALYD